MNSKIIGLIFHTCGVIMLTRAYLEYFSAASKVSRFIKGAPSEKVIILVVAGAACALFGTYNIFKKGRK